jgi:hypothetical protein
MLLCVMHLGSSSGVISHHILLIVYYPSLFPIAQVPFYTIPRRVQAVYTITLDFTATNKRSPDRVGFVAPCSYALFRWIRGSVDSHGLPHRISMLYTLSLIFPSPPFVLGPASVKCGSDVSTLSARAGD